MDGAPVEKLHTVLLMLHKPAGYVTSADDPGGPSVLELIPERFRRFGVMPVGRLDKATEGLLLFTNDGVLAHKLISPRFGVWKRYYAEHEGTAGEADVAAFAAGLTLGDGTKCLPARLTPLGAGKAALRYRKGNTIRCAGCSPRAVCRSPIFAAMRRERWGWMALKKARCANCRFRA